MWCVYCYTSRETEAYKLLFQREKNYGVESEFNDNPPLILTEKQRLNQHNKIWAFYCDDTELI